MGLEIERYPINTTQDVLEQREKMIQNLQTNIEEAGTLCKKMNSEIVSLREDKDKLQGEYNKLITKQYHTDYQIENQKNVIENIHKTLNRYEKENKAMRELLSLWI